MNDSFNTPDAAGKALALTVLNAIQNPVIMVNEDGFIPCGSPLLALIDQVRERLAPVNEYRVDLSSPRLG